MATTTQCWISHSSLSSQHHAASWAYYISPLRQLYIKQPFSDPKWIPTGSVRTVTTQPIVSSFSWLLSLFRFEAWLDWFSGSPTCSIDFDQRTVITAHYNWSSASNKRMTRKLLPSLWLYISPCNDKTSHTLRSSTWSNAELIQTPTQHLSKLL